MQFLKKIDPYLRLGRFDRPIGGWLVFWPASYASVLSSYYGAIDPISISVVFSATFMLRAAGCAANDIWDRKFDKLVERTKARPIASGELSVLQGSMFSAFNFAPLPVMWYLMEETSRMCLYALVPVITLYPLAKRFTNWPQGILGISMNYGFLVNYVYINGHIDLFLVPFYVALWSWTLIYDTIYAYQDMKQDKEIGIKSTTLAWGDNYLNHFKWLTLTMGAAWAAGGYIAGLGGLFYPASSYAIWKVYKTWKGLDIENPADCSKRFLSNHQIGKILFLSLLLGKLSQKKNN